MSSKAIIFNLILGVLVLSGCTQRVFVYEGTHESSLISVKSHTGTEAKYNAWIKLVYDSAGRELTGNGAWHRRGGMNDIRLPVGSYKFEVLCTNGHLEGTFELEVNVVNNPKYEIYCDVEEKTFLGWSASAKGGVKLRELK